MPDEWIRQWGDPTLHETASPIAGVDDIVRAQVRRMERRLIEAGGAALAATQVGIMRRVFVYRLTRDDRIDVLINPVVVAASRQRKTFLEGCLSFQSVIVPVERADAVTVCGIGLDGREREIEAEGVAASLMQHEIDHLDGILTLDRADPAERRRVVAELLRLAA